MSSTCLVCRFLFFIDEGYYDLRWMKGPGNWLVFLIYTISIFALQLFFYEVLLINYRRSGKVQFRFAGSLLAGLALLV